MELSTARRAAAPASATKHAPEGQAQPSSSPESDSSPLPWHSLSSSPPLLCAALQEGSPCRCLPHRAHTPFKARTRPLEQLGAQGRSHGSDAALHCLHHLSGADISLSLLLSIPHSLSSSLPLSISFSSSFTLAWRSAHTRTPPQKNTKTRFSLTFHRIFFCPDARHLFPPASDPDYHPDVCHLRFRGLGLVKHLGGVVGLALGSVHLCYVLYPFAAACHDVCSHHGCYGFVLRLQPHEVIAGWAQPRASPSAAREGGVWMSVPEAMHHPVSEDAHGISESARL